MQHGHTYKWGEVTDDGAEIWDSTPLFRQSTVGWKDRLLLLMYPKKWFTYRWIEKDFKKESIDRSVQEPYRVLDVGCGTGSSVVDFKKLFGRRADVVGLDVVALQLDLGKKKLKEHGVVGDLVYYDGQQFPFSDNSFDAVYSSDVLGHVPDVELWLAEVARVLKPGGVIAMFCESELGRHAYIRKYLKDRGLNIDPHAQFHISLYQKKELRQFFEEAGFEIVTMKSSFWAAFFVHPEEFYPVLQSQKKYLLLRLVNKVLTFIKEKTKPLSLAVAELYGLVEMIVVGSRVEAQGYVVLGRKKK